MSASDLTFLTATGDEVSLRSFLTSERLLLVFLRHLACIPCVAHLAELAKHYERFRDAGVNVLAVSQAKPAVLAMHLRHTPQPFPVVCDPERVSYRVFGLERTNFWSFLRPSVLWGYLHLILRGSKVHRPNKDEDLYQLAGDFLLNRTGDVEFSYRSRTATDSPTVEQLLAAIADSVKSSS